MRLRTKSLSLPDDFPQTRVEAPYRSEITQYTRRALSESLFSRSMVSYARHAHWGGLFERPSGDWLEDFTHDKLEQKQQDLIEIADQAVKEQVEAGNAWFVKRFSTTLLEKVLVNQPDIVAQWLDLAMSETNESARVVPLCRSFYEAICSVLLRTDPVRGASLYRQLCRTNGKVEFRDSLSGLFWLDHALFSESGHKDVADLWTERIEQCTTDKQLMEIAILAQHGLAGEWLWSYIQDHIPSSSPLDSVRAITLLAFVHSEEARDSLQALLDGYHNTWSREIMEKSLLRWQTNAWAKHWFRRFLTVEDDVIAWASFRLLLRCVDSRFWSWYEGMIVNTLCTEIGQKKIRLDFLDANLDSLKNSVKNNEKKLREEFLCQRTLDGQAWPWMTSYL